MTNVMLEVNDLTTKYITRFGEDVYAVDHVSLRVEEGRSLGIAGESGYHRDGSTDERIDS